MHTHAAPPFAAALWRSAGLLLVALALALATGCASAPKEPVKLVQWDIEASHPYVLASDQTEAVVHVDVSAKLPASAQTRIPLNLSLVLDHSGSMSGDQMDDARRAVLDMLDKLHPEDRISVVAFSTRAEVLQPQETWSDVDRVALRRKVSALKPRGTTAMYAALQQGLNQVQKRYNAASINRVLLFSDGIPNDPTNLVALAQNARSRNIAITTMGLGPYYNEDLMAQLADLSGGNYRFIKSSDQIETFFLAEKQSMEQIVARNVNVAFNLGPGVQVLQTLGSNAQVSGRSVRVFLGELGSAETRQVALKLRVQAPASGAKVELLDAQLTWEDVVAWTGNHERWSYLEAESTQDQALIEQHRNKQLAEKVGRLQAAWEIDQAMRDYQAGERRRAQERLQRAAEEYRAKRVEAEASRPTNAPPPMAAPQDFDQEVMVIQSAGSLDVYMDELSEEVEESDPESDDGKILIKSNKRRSRSMSGK